MNSTQQVTLSCKSNTNRPPYSTYSLNLNKIFDILVLLKNAILQNVFIRPISAHAPWRNLMESSTARRSKKLRWGRFTWAADFAKNARNIWRSRNAPRKRRKTPENAEVIFPCYSHPGGPYFADRGGSWQNAG